MIQNTIVNEMKKAKKLNIFPHISADGDAIGSSLALALALKKLNKQVRVYLEEEIPSIYNFLPGQDVIVASNSKMEFVDLGIAIDTGDLLRLGDRLDRFNNSVKTINIDHHSTNTEFGFYNYINNDSAAVGEIIYQFIKMMGLDMDEEIAVCLYVAIITDTGGFRYSNTTSLTHQITADLINNGVNVSMISKIIFDTTSIEKLRLTSIAINNLELLENGKIAVIMLSDQMLKEASAKDEDCEGLINIGRNIRGVEVAFVLKKKLNGEVKVNFRSNNYVDVASIANMYKGGGHKKASGCTVTGDIQAIKEMIVKDIKELL